MISLSQFVAETLQEIIDGVTTAQKYATSKKACVNPAGLQLMANNPAVTSFSRDGRQPQVVQFEVGVTTSEGTGTKGGIGVFVGAIGLGTHGQSDKALNASNRISFSVPLLLPGQSCE